MPVLAVARDYLFQLLDRTFTQDEFAKLCFEFGVELDEVTSERQIFEREHAKASEAGAGGEKGGDKQAQKAYQKQLSELSDRVIYKIDTPANRYDLQSPESIAIALRVFLGMAPPVLRLANATSPHYRMIVDSSVQKVRDYVVCAVLKNITFTSEAYNSFIDFQEKLHAGLARKRTLASVGTHDLDKVIALNQSEPPSATAPLELHYSLTPKNKLKFVPLNQNGRELNCADNGLEEYYKNDRHIGKYVPIVSHLPSYPTVLDSSKKTLLSMPPIINSDISKIDINTRNVFIECTATDAHKASVLVNQMVCAFSWHCDVPFEVDAVEVRYPEDVTVPGQPASNVVITPDFRVRDMTIDVPTVSKRVGIDLSTDECAKILQKMYLFADKATDTSVKIGIPPARSDILDPCDIVEDVAIAYGYDNIFKQPAQTHSFGYQQPISKLSHLLRIEIANAGYTEMLTLSLCSRDEAFAHLGRTDDNVAVHIENPQTQEFQVCRPSLLPGTLKTLNASKSLPLPLKLFEITDVVLLTEQSKDNRMTGAKNERHFCALHCVTDTNAFEDIHGLVEYTFAKLAVPSTAEITAAGSAAAAGTEAPSRYAYELREGNDGAFFPGRVMVVVLVEIATGNEKVIGHFGVIHPRTLKAYEIPFPCSYCEFSIQDFA